MPRSTCPATYRVVLLSKGAVDECDSMLAQGGICVLPEAGDYQAFFDDTLRAGHGENRRESVDIMIRSSRAVINDLVALGVDFERERDGSLAFTREGAHSRPRICYRADITGREITTKLLGPGAPLAQRGDLGARGAHRRHRGARRHYGRAPLHGGSGAPRG